MDTEKTCPNCHKPLPADVPLGLCPECLLKAGFPTESPAATAGFVPPPVEEIAKLFPQLEILGFLGKGGMGAVYKARQPSLDRLVALKILPPALSNEPGFAERFNREAQALARLSHPNIVAVHDFGRAGELPYLLMELVDGINLREMEQTAQLTPAQALAIVPQICDALQYAHNEGIVHRDIKPENLLLDKKGRVKITDFGIAKILAIPSGKLSLTGVKDVVGTPHYMAPEQIEKPQTVDHRADIYSLGVVFYEMLTGELPLGKFQAPSQKVQMDVRLDEVVLRTLEKEPDRRYQQVGEVKTRVENITSTPPPHAAANPSLAAAPVSTNSDKIIFPAFLLAFFFGMFGAHRLYVGKLRTGFLQLGAAFGVIPLIVAIVFAGGSGEPLLGLLLGALVVGCGIWWIVDWILLLCKAFNDGEGKRINRWFTPDSRIINPPPTYPGNSGASGNPPPPFATASHVPGEPKAMIIAPAVAMIVAAGLRIVTALTALLFFSGPVTGFVDSILSGFGIDVANLSHAIAAQIVLFAIIPSVVIIYGAAKMCSIRGYGWALAAAILSIIAILSWHFISFGIGIWALVILCRSDVRTAFASPRAPSSSSPVKWPWIFGATAAAAILFVLAVALLNATAHRVAARSPALAGFLPALDDSDYTSFSEPDDSDPNTQKNEVGSSTTFSKTLAVGSAGRLMMKLDRGDVEVTGSDTNAFTIVITREVTRASDSEAAKILGEENIVLKQNSNDLSVTSRTPPSLNTQSFWRHISPPNLNVHYHITVPKGFDTHIGTLGGQVTVTGLQTNVFAKTAGGALHFDDINGDVDGHTMGGDIHATACTKSMTIRTLGGEINVKKFSGPEIHATTIGGDVTVDFATAPKSICELHTTGGNITARLPDSAAITIDAHTLGGSVTSDLPVQLEGKKHDNSLQGTLNGGGPELKLQTMGGDISLHKHTSTSK